MTRISLVGSTILHAVLGALLVIASVVSGQRLSMTAERVPLTVALSCGLAWMLIAVHRWLRIGHHAPYVLVVDGPRKTTKSAVWGYRTDAVFWVFYAFVALFVAVEATPSTVQYLFTSIVTISLVHGVLTALQERPFRRWAATMLAYTPVAARPNERVLLEWRVSPEEGEGVLQNEVQLHWSIQTVRHHEPDGTLKEMSDASLVDEARTVTRKKTIEIQSLWGDQRIDVDLHHAEVAFANRVLDKTTSDYRYVAPLKGGDFVCVLARLEERDGKLVARADGEQPLQLWGGTRSQLRRWLWFARAKIGLLLIVGAIAGWIGVRTMPHAAKYVASATVEGSTMPHVPNGARCTVKVWAYRRNYTGRCSVVLECQGVDLYGGSGRRPMSCELASSPRDPAVRGEDSSERDGDAAIRFDLSARRLRWRDDRSNSLTIRLDEPKPVWWL